MSFLKKDNKKTASPSVSKATIQLVNLGLLSEQNWNGPVSAERLVTQKETTREKLEHAAEHINDFYVSVNPKAKTRCIDGRHDPEMDETNLGPQVPGGAPGAAIAYRLGVDKDDLTRGTFLDDAETMIAQFIRLGFSPGGHRDELSDGKNAVGCGAIDGMNRILATMADPTRIEDHKRIVKALLGNDFNRDHYLRVLGAALVVNGRSDEYFRNREAIIDILEKRFAKSISVLKGEHKEGLVIVNMVPNTTLSSNRFAEKYDGVQAFGYDLWRSRQMAERILPLPSQEIDRQRFVMARIMSTVSTLMVLTDGSQRLLVRMPS